MKRLELEDLRKLARLHLIARWVVEGFLSGLHRSPYHGASVEFAEYREYVPGDDLRHFDWKALARSDRRYIKRYRSETSAKAHILLDASRSMAFGSGALSKFEYAVYLAAALAYLLIRQHDAVGLAVFADRILHRRSPGSNPRHRREIFDLLESLAPASTTDIAGALTAIAESVRSRGIIILISDLYEDPPKVLEALRRFRFDRHEVIVFHLVDPAEREFPYEGLIDVRDLETGEKVEAYAPAIREAYREGFAAHLRTIGDASADAGVDYQIVDTATTFDEYLAWYLAARRRAR